MKLKHKDRAIGVFDSGLGGLSVLSTLMDVFDHEQYIYYGDSLHAPYGVKSAEDVLEFSHNIVNWFIKRDVKAIVIACNTATSVSAKFLRENYDIPIIGMEPAIKPAVEHFKKSEQYTKYHKHKKIAVMATDMTLREKKFSDLLSKLEMGDSILKIPCPELVELVERGITKGKDVENAIKKCFYAQGVSEELFQDIYSIVLGCTHFSFVKEAIYEVFGKDTAIFDGNEGTARHLKRLVESNERVSLEEKMPDNKLYEEVKQRLGKFDIRLSSKENKELICNTKEDICYSKKYNNNIEIYNSLSYDMVEKSIFLLNKMSRDRHK